MHLFYIIFLIESILAVIFFIFCSRKKRVFVKKDIASNNRDLVYLLSALVILFFFHAFRDPFSLVDTPEYAEAYKEALGYSWQKVFNESYSSLKSELGFRLIIKGISCLFSSYQMLFVITSGFMIFSVYRAIQKYSVFYWISVMIFVVSSFAQSLFLLRAFISICILLFSFPYIIERKLVPYILICILSMSIHVSSVIFLPVYFLYGIKNTKFLLTIFVVVGIFFLLFFNDIIFLIVERYFPEYSYYLLNIDNYEGASWKMPAILGLLLMMRIELLNKSFFEAGITRLLSVITIMAFIVYIAGMGFGLTSRMAMFFTNMTFLILPDTISHMRNRPLGVLIAVIYILFNSFFFLRNSTDPLWVNYRLI